MLNEFKTSFDNDEDNAQDNENTVIGNWWQNEYPAQNNQDQATKVTDRKQRVQFFDNDNFQMNREKLGVNQSYPLPVSQGTMNPNLKNTVTRILSIDSQYRDNFLDDDGGEPSYSSPAFNGSFTVNLSENLKNVISLKLYSIEIPTTWYTFDTTLGNTCFKIGDYDDAICGCINPGNYDISGLTQEIIRIANDDAGISLTFDISGATNIINITSVTDASFIYYEPNGLNCDVGCIGGSYINQNIGWYLGFRRQPDDNGKISIDLPANSTIYADVPANTYGPKYCFLVLDDFNQNRLNKGVVNISDTSTKLDLPSYYSPSDLSGCTTDLRKPYVDVPNVWISDTKPKNLTNAQLYTIQETLDNRIQPIGRITGPTASDILARISLKNITSLRPEPLIETGTHLQTNERTYFGPVDIERIKVSLIDDKGYPLNLHDNDWSFSINSRTIISVLTVG